MKWDMEIALLEDAIREEKEKIGELDKALLEYGEIETVNGEQSSNIAANVDDRTEKSVISS